MLNQTPHRALLIGLLCLAAICLPLRAQELKSIPPGSLNGALPAPANGVPVPLDPPVLPSPSISNAPAPATAARAVPPAVPPAPAETEAALDPLERNDFQELIGQTLGQRLPLFGYSLFARPPSTFAPVDNIPVTPDYLIGPGDELLIRAWGQIDVDYRAVVDRNGTISIPQIGVLPVASVRYADLTGHVRTAVGRNFHNFKLMVTLGQLRSVQVFVVGHARRPGVYTVSSLSTLVNAIFAAGGPSASGSMRTIELKRGGATVTRFDLYELLLKGDKSKDMALLPGDVIYFPPLGALAAVAGAVRKPGIYELNGAASAATLIQYAGGLSTTAQTRLAAIERIDNRRSRSADSFQLDARGLARGIKDGDLLNVLHISPKFENSVTLRGQVAQPLRHPYRSGMRSLTRMPLR